MDEIKLPKEEKNPEFLLRRPSRAERNVDDPIREMDGMFVDEYGRFATSLFFTVFVFYNCTITSHYSSYDPGPN